MRINKNLLKNSESFKNVEKDLNYIVSKIAQDDILLKLLSLQENNMEPLSSEERKEILQKCIKIIPKIDNINETDWSFIGISFDNFVPNLENPEYRDKTLIFDIVCNFDTWNLGDFKLRPYQIAGRLDVLFDKQSLADTYTIDFMSAENIIVDDEIAGVNLVYSVIYGKASDIEKNNGI
jgi:hypothetical protein